ncbi:MAG TPA: sigma-70 family RNA polymerase sigma factor [Myxococcota bacterium]
MSAQRAYARALQTARSCGLRGADAEDVAGAAVQKALAAWDRFVDDGAQRAEERWIVTIARNIIRDRYRRTQSHKKAESLVRHTQHLERVAAQTPRPDRALRNHAAQAARDALLASLVPQVQVVVRLAAQVVAGEISRADAAKQIGLSVHAWDKVAHKAKLELARAVAEQNIDVASLFDSDGEGDPA